MGKFFAGFGIIWLAVWVLGIWMWVEGLIMTFHSSIVLGIVGLFLQVPFVLETLVWWFAHYDIAMHIAQALALP